MHFKILLPPSYCVCFEPTGGSSSQPFCASDFGVSFDQEYLFLVSLLHHCLADFDVVVQSRILGNW